MRCWCSYYLLWCVCVQLCAALSGNTSRHVWQQPHAVFCAVFLRYHGLGFLRNNLNSTASQVKATCLTFLDLFVLSSDGLLGGLSHSNVIKRELTLSTTERVVLKLAVVVMVTDSNYGQSPGWTTTHQSEGITSRKGKGGEKREIRQRWNMFVLPFCER